MKIENEFPTIERGLQNVQALALMMTSLPRSPNLKDPNNDSCKHVHWNLELVEIHEFKESAELKPENTVSTDFVCKSILKRKKSDCSDCSDPETPTISRKSERPVRLSKSGGGSSFLHLDMAKMNSVDDCEKTTSDYRYPNKKFLVTLLGEKSKVKSLVDSLK